MARTSSRLSTAFMRAKPKPCLAAPSKFNLLAGLLAHLITLDSVL